MVWNDAAVSAETADLLSRLSRRADVIVALPEAMPMPTLDEADEVLVTTALERTGGNRSHAAELLDVTVKTIRNRIDEFGLPAAPKWRPRA